MFGKGRSVQPDSFAQALSTLGPSWASRLEVQNEAKSSGSEDGVLKRTPCQVRGGILAAVICLLGLSV